MFWSNESISGSDPSSMETKFEEVSDGFIINGSKNWITNALLQTFF